MDLGNLVRENISFVKCHPLLQVPFLFRKEPNLVVKLGEIVPSSSFFYQ